MPLIWNLVEKPWNQKKGRQWQLTLILIEWNDSKVWTVWNVNSPCFAFILIILWHDLCCWVRMWILLHLYDVLWERFEAFTQIVPKSFAAFSRLVNVSMIHKRLTRFFFFFLLFLLKLYTIMFPPPLFFFFVGLDTDLSIGFSEWVINGLYLHFFLHPEVGVCWKWKCKIYSSKL
jgi:hypothetical protein